MTKQYKLSTKYTSNQQALTFTPGMRMSSFCACQGVPVQRHALVPSWARLRAALGQRRHPVDGRCQRFRAFCQGCSTILGTLKSISLCCTRRGTLGDCQCSSKASRKLGCAGCKVQLTLKCIAVVQHKEGRPFKIRLKDRRLRNEPYSLDDGFPTAQSNERMVLL